MTRIGRAFCIGIAALALLSGVTAARAADPIKIGFSIELTGPLAAVGKTGLLGRQVQLVFYDDQGNPSNVPGIYTKLIEIDKVDLLISSYGTNLVAPAMPIVMQKNRLFFGLFALGVNSEFHYPKYFSMLVFGPDPKPTFSKGWFDIAIAQNPKPQTVALVTADAEFGRNALDGARDNIKKLGLKTVYDRAYPPTTVDYTPIVRAVQAASADLVYVASYLPDTVGILRAVNETGLTTNMFGGALVGTPTASLRTQMGPLLNGLVVGELWEPTETMNFPGIWDFLKQYQAKAPGEGIDALGYFLPPFAYGEMQILGDAITAVGSLDEEKLAQYMHGHAFKTVVGDISFGPDGEWTEPRSVFVQYHGIKGNDLDQFRDDSRITILYPSQYKSGEVVWPYNKARD